MTMVLILAKRGMMAVVAFVRAWLALIWATRVQIFAVIALFALNAAPQMQDSYSEPVWSQLPAWLEWSIFSALVAVFVALPIYETAQTAIDLLNNPGKSSKPGWRDNWAALLGTAAIAAFCVGIGRAYWQLAPASADPDPFARVPADMAAATHLSYAALPMVFGVVLLLFLIALNLVRRDRLSIGTQKPKAIEKTLIYWLLASIEIGAALIAITLITFPLEVSAIAPRHFVMALMLGGTVVLFAGLAHASSKTGIPWAFLALAGIGAINLVSPPDYPLRTLPGSAADVSSRQTPINIAIDDWKAKHNCQQDASKCPKPILIAMEGGASRAALTAMTMAGALLDRKSGAEGKAAIAPDTIFAVSGVSGGAVGAVTLSAALGAAKDGKPPCVMPLDATLTWQSCLQQLVAGDYLTPTLIGTIYRDPFSFIARWFDWKYDDRSILLERAIERHFLQVTGEPSTDCMEADNAWRGLCRPFSRSARTDTGTAAAQEPWRPYLILGATRVDTGRPVLFSEIAPLQQTGDNDAANDRPGAAFSNDAFALMTTTACQAAPAPGVRMSTAAVVSARFPVITPPAVLDCEGSERPVVRIVDGGYFDNSGLTALRAVARKLADSDLEPILVQISNEPEPTKQPNAAEENTLVDTARLFLGAAEPAVATLIAVREARVSEVFDTTSEIARGPVCKTDGLCHFFHLKVFSGILPVETCSVDTSTDSKAIAIADVPINWWLSGSSRARLGLQACESTNLSVLDTITALETAAIEQSKPRFTAGSLDSGEMPVVQGFSVDKQFNSVVIPLGLEHPRITVPLETVETGSTEANIPVEPKRDELRDPMRDLYLPRLD